MSDDFEFDVFLSHSSKDKAVARDIAQRLRKDGVKVWFDEWEIQPGNSIPAKIEEGLERSRVLVLCMSANAFGSNWAQLESGTFRFRDPLNKERRFLPLRLDDAPIKGSLAQFLYISWLPAECELEYAKLLEACRPLAKQPLDETEASHELRAEKAIKLQQLDEIRQSSERPQGYPIRSYDFTPDRKLAVTGCSDNTVRLWDVESGRCLRVLKGHGEAKPGYSGGVWRVAWATDGNQALSASMDSTMRLWDMETGQCLLVFGNQVKPVQGLAWSPDGRRALSAGGDAGIRLWSRQSEICLREFKGHKEEVLSVAWSADGRRALSGSLDHTVRVWDIETGRCLKVLDGHSEMNG